MNKRDDAWSESDGASLIARNIGVREDWASPVADDEPDEDIWAGYDPEEARRALEETAGSWADLDIDGLITTIYEAREAGSRPPDRS